MGNHNSRMSRGSTATINDDPCLDNLRQWHTTSKNDPYKRQYPLPSIANDLSNNRIKPRKQSSPAAVNRRSFTRFLNFRQQPPLILESTNDEMISKPTSSTSSSLHSQQQQQPDAVHPLAAPVNPCSNISLDQKSYKEENIGRSMDSRRHQRHHSDNYHQSTTTSSSINNNSYRMSGKRKYHDVNGSHYLLPCDEEEVDRLHLAHFMVRFAIQG